MKFTATTAILLAAGTTQVAAVGNGQTTNNIKFNGLPGSYTYQRATSLQPNGNCVMGNVQADGPLAPLTNEMHHVFRGPLNLLQFAVYQPKAGQVKRDSIRESTMERRGRISHFDKHKRAHDHADAEKRDFGNMVTATINGQVVTFADNWSPQAATPAPNAAAPPASAPAQNVAVQAPADPAPAPANPAPAPGPNTGPDSPSTGSTTSAWHRIAYLNTTTKHAENIAITANLGMGQDAGFGYIQKYVTPDATGIAASPQILDGFIPDNYEVFISSATACSPSDTSGGCAVVAPESATHHGFGGDRVVIMEYTMPESSCSDCTNKATGMSPNTNLPAIWALGSDVVNIAQYGFAANAACSGWESGAGEFDLHEILSGGMPTDIGYASFHMGGHYSGTPPQGFVRPTDPNKSQKLAYVLSGSSASIHILGSDFDIDEGLSADDVNAMMAAGSDASNGAFANSKIAKSGAPAYPASVPSASFDCILHA